MPRHTVHPDAKLDAIAEKVEALREARPLPSKAWRWPYGFVLMLWEPNGTRHAYDVAGDYEDAASKRDQEMATGRYEKAWLFQKNGPRLER